MASATKLSRLLVFFAVFIACFAIPVLLITRSGTDEEIQRKTEKRDTLIPTSVTVNRENMLIRIPHRPEFVPKLKRDYILLFWAALRSLPNVGDRLVLLSKNKGTPPRVQGFAIGLRRDSTSTRPVLFWGDGTEAGRWYDFPEISIAAKEWNMFALHVHEGRFVGLYFARVGPSEKAVVKFLGGHEILLPDPLNIGDAEVLFGAPAGREFRGKIGPLAIINPLDRSKGAITSVLETYVENPMDFSPIASSSQVQLAILDGRVDSSEHNVELESTFAVDPEKKKKQPVSD